MTQELLTTLTRKGQITVPAPIRRALRLKEGDRVALSIREGREDEAVLRPVRSVVDATYGVAESAAAAPELHAMREQFEAGLAIDALRGSSLPESTR